ncbi:GNAT family N-acetyltransferase [Paenibacillus jamilae]|uniref:GNAT family N-acetyltransferase n=1 Tax=Paenibacillus jamilae TaxID=114136 RepID=UPI003D2E5088
MTIRLIEMKDVQQVAEWEREIAILSFGDEAITDLAFHMRKLEKAAQYEPAGMLVWETAEYLAGWMWMSKRVNSVTQEAYIHLKSFFIREVYRGTPGGRDLFGTGMQWAINEGCRHILGHVNVHNMPMRALYEKYGFAPTHLTMEFRVSPTEKDEQID